MIRTILLGLAVGALALATAFAQESGAATAPGEAAQEALPGGETGSGEEFEAPPSELDLLSRTEDKTFSDLEETMKRRPVSVTLRALDKITARYKDIESPIGEPVKFGSLEVLPRYCDKRPPEEFPETSAFLEIFDRDLSRARAASSVEARPLDAKKAAREPAAQTQGAAAPVDDSETPVQSASDPDRIFSGWMFASSPALNPLEHAVYDVWVIDCKTEIVEN